MKTFVRFVNDESAATAIEYCLIATLISIAILVGVGGAGTALNATYKTVANALN